MKKNNKHVWRISATTLTMMVASGLFLTGCSQNTAPSIDKAEKAVTEAAKDTKEAVGDAASAAGDAVKQAGDKLSEGFAAATEKAAEALKGIDGGTELLTKVTDFFSSAKKTLQGISDSDTAKAAESKLSELGKSADSLVEMTSKLPEKAKTTIAGLIKSGLAELKVLIDKVDALPGVSDVIKPKLDELAEKFKALTGK